MFNLSLVVIALAGGIGIWVACALVVLAVRTRVSGISRLKQSSMVPVYAPGRVPVYHPRRARPSTGRWF